MEKNEGMPRPRDGEGIQHYRSEIGESALFSAFMSAFGGWKRCEFTDVADNVLLIDRRLFETLSGKWKIKKRGRAEWLMFTAENIKRPDEIWLETSDSGGPDKLYHLSRFEVGKRGLLSCIAVFERERGLRGAWAGRTNYATLQDGYAEKKSRGKALIYRRRDRQQGAAAVQAGCW
jgi:hypothetical protein